MIGNSKGLHIFYLSSNNFKSSFQANKFLLMATMLHIPNIAKNLLSVVKFAQDNNVFLVSYLLLLC